MCVPERGLIGRSDFLLLESNEDLGYAVTVLSAVLKIEASSEPLVPNIYPPVSIEEAEAQEPPER